MDSDSEESTETQDEAPTCSNCHRKIPIVDSKQWEDVYRLSRKTYFGIIGRPLEVFLCTECNAYLIPGSNKGAWAPMVWKFLSETNENNVMSLTMEEKWKYIPVQWREWWLPSVENAGLTLHCPAPEVFDVSEAKLELGRALSTLRWRTMAPAMDKYLAYPSVRCPWGCGTYLHETNEVPYEDLLLVKSNYAFRSTSTVNRNKGRRAWVDSCRPDFPSSTIILENDDFVCQPCVILTEEGPKMLCCKKHDAKTVQRMLHVPVNPTGSLFTDCSNQYAPLVLKSRTIRTTKLNVFSDTYKTVALQGGYDGVDSSYCCSVGNRHQANHLSRWRDYLMLSGRQDVRHHFQMLCESNQSANYLPKENICEMLHRADSIFPEGSFRSQEATSTYVSVQQSVLIQESTYEDKPLTLLTGLSQMAELFQPPWPSCMIRVHPYDPYGERFTGVVQSMYRREERFFHFWCILTCILCVDDLWHKASRCMTTDCDLYGYLMAYAWKHRQLDTGRPAGKKGGKFYALLDAQSDADNVLLLLDAPSLAESLPWPIIPGCRNLAYMQNQWNESDVDEGTEYVILTFSDFQSVTYEENPMGFNGLAYEGIARLEISNEVWEPVLIISAQKVPSTCKATVWDASVYSKHGQPIHVGWWMQEHANEGFKKCNVGSSFRTKGNVRLVIYKRRCGTLASQMRDRYLRFLGGQTAVFCARHKHPLTLAYKEERKCCCDGNDIATTGKEWDSIETTTCKKNASYVCPNYDCEVAICGADFSTLCDCIGTNSYLLSENSCRRTCYQQASSVSHMIPEPVEQDDETMIFRHSIDRNDSYQEEENMGNDSVHEEDDDNVDEENANDEDSDEELHYGPSSGFESIYDLVDVDAPQEYSSDSDDNADMANVGPLHPMTVAQREENLTLEMDVPTEQNQEILSIPLHVFLNRQGHCLVRRNAKLRPSQRHKAFLQRMVARSKGKCVPLLYGEGSLFPDIFYAASPEGAVLGALPTALWTDHHTMSRHGVASMRSHACVRITDPALLTCTDSRYHFLTMDTLVNLGLRGNDSRLLLHRGFAESQGKNEGIAFRVEDGTEELYDDNVDNHSNVHKLSRLCEEDPGHFFYTQSCNSDTARALGILRKWITSTRATEKVMKKYNLTKDEAQDILRTSAAPFVQSAWNVFIDIWMNYIIHSPEEPLGRVDWAWIRKEFQDKTGNVSHIHSIIKTCYDASTEEGRNMIQDKIRGCLADLVRQEEIPSMVEKGILPSAEPMECLINILNQAKKFLPHHCGPRCQVVKKDENGHDVFICKRPYNWLLTSNPGVHSMEEVQVSHTSTSLDILRELGFASRQFEGQEISITNPLLQMSRHIPKCSKGDGRFSPTNGQLFAMYPSASNLQYVSGHCLSAYLSSYIAEVDRVAIVHIQPPTSHAPNILRGKYESLNNTKIKGVKRHHETRLIKRRVKVPMGRPVTQMEALTVIKGEPLVRSTRFFIHLPTSPREFRAAADAPYVKTSCRPQDLQAVLAVTGQTSRLRKNFSSSRCFTDHQLMVIRDELRAPLQTDLMTHFSMRPPELIFVDSCVDYVCWFTRKGVCPLFDPAKALAYLGSVLDLREDKSPWLDGFNYQVKLRYAAIQPLYNFAKARMADTSHFRKPTQATMRLLGKLAWMSAGYPADEIYVYTRRTKKEMESLCTMFLVDRTVKKLPVVWWTPINPRRKTAFLVHLLLCMGRFTTEYELMLQGNMRASFVESGLLDPNNPSQSLVNILRKYVLHQLRVQPGNVYQFDRNLAEAYDLLKNTFSPRERLHEGNFCLGTPPVLYSAIIRDTSQKVTTYLRTRREEFITAIYGELRNCGLLHLVPEREAIMNSRTVPIPQEEIDQFFPPPLNENQSEASHVEQTAIMVEFKKSVQAYKSGCQPHKNFIVVGGPGVGKTTVTTFCCLFCLAVGLYGIATSLVADRSKALGGVHFHRLIGMRGQSESVSPGRAAELALQYIFRHPEMLEFIRRQDFMNLDEFGLFPAEYVAIMDIVYRYIRGCSLFMGGLLLFGTMDHLQLLPFHGTPVLLSLYIVTDFTFFRLKESVRAWKDTALQEIINLTRTIHWTREKKERFKQLLRDNVNFVDSFDHTSIPSDAIFIFGRKEPCRVAENILLEKMKATHAGAYTTSMCHDEESTTGGNWHLASERTSRHLDKRLKQRRSLVFYPCAKFEFTQVLKGKFNQGQLALLLEIPSSDTLQQQNPITLLAAPSGIKHYPDVQDCNRPWLLEHGWYDVKVPFTTSPNQQIMKGVQARRTQYPLKPRVSSTIHACMGSTLSAIVSSVVSLAGMPYNFSLWEAAQVVVLLSRTRTAKAIYFIGDRESTIQHLLDVLSGQQYRYLRFITSLLLKLCSEESEGVANPIHVLPQPTQFRPQDAELPRGPAVYLIVSTKNPAFEYIGETSHLVKRLEDHNSLRGPPTTAHADLLPYAVHAYVIGFVDKSERLQFEAEWKIRNMRTPQISLNNNGKVDIALQMIATRNADIRRAGMPNLRVVCCGYIETVTR